MLIPVWFGATKNNPPVPKFTAEDRVRGIFFWGGQTKRIYRLTLSDRIHTVWFIVKRRHGLQARNTVAIICLGFKASRPIRFGAGLFFLKLRCTFGRSMPQNAPSGLDLVRTFEPKPNKLKLLS